MLAKEILSNWEKQHWKNIILELREAGIELTEEDIPRIIEETSFRVRSRKHPVQFNQLEIYLTGLVR